MESLISLVSAMISISNVCVGTGVLMKSSFYICTNNEAMIRILPLSNGFVDTGQFIT